MMNIALLQLCLAALSFAAPTADDLVSTSSINPAQQYGGGVFGLIVLILDILVWVELLRSSRPASHKLLWALLVFIFPIGGIVIYWLFSDRAKYKSGSAGYEPIS